MRHRKGEPAEYLVVGFFPARVLCGPRALAPKEFHIRCGGKQRLAGTRDLLIQSPAKSIETGLQFVPQPGSFRARDLADPAILQSSQNGAHDSEQGHGRPCKPSALLKLSHPL